MYSPRQLEGPLRFGFTLAAGGALLKLLILAMPAELTSPVAERLSSTAGQLAADAFTSTLLLTIRGVLLAMPLALLLALPVFAWPSGWAARILRALVAMLTGIPALVTVLLVMGILAMEARLITLESGMLATLALLLAPWLARALVDSAGSPRVAAGLLARQTGNLLLGALVGGLFAAPAAGGLQTLELAAFRQDLPLIYAILSMAIPAVALLHLLGDLLVGDGVSPAGSAGRTPMAAGAILASCLAVMALLPAGEGARLSLLLAAGATLIALAGATMLGLLSRAGGLLGQAAFTPQGLSLALMPPFLLGTVAVALNGRSLFWLTVAIGIGSVPVLLGPMGRLLRAGAGERRPLWPTLAGGLILVLAQALLTEIN